MKKYIIFIIFAFILKQTLSGQVNLVPNPSFEAYVTCPNNLGQVNYAIPWFQPYDPSSTPGGSSDFYHQCSPFGPVSVPNNTTGVGYQTPRTGGGYSGIILKNSSLIISSREYIQTSLSSKLLKDKMYCVEFYVSLANNSFYSISNIGAYFSNDSIIYYSPTLSNLPFVPQIENDSTNIISDTLNWVLISGQFIASGGENFMTIGNFRDNLNTNSQNLGGTQPFAYYYFDDISVICCDCDTTVTTNISVPNVFTPNNDNTNDFFKISSTGLESLNCKIYNRWGIQVGELIDTNDVWDGRTTAGIECPDGVYFYVFKAKGMDEKEYNQKGFIQLIK